MKRMDLGPLVAPRSIAIVGASEATDAWAPEFHRSLEHVGFTGELYPVNPKYEEVWGRPCLSSPLELPKGVDLLVFLTSPPGSSYGCSTTSRGPASAA